LLRGGMLPKKTTKNTHRFALLRPGMLP